MIIIIYIDDTSSYENYKGKEQLFETYITTDEYDADKFEDYSHFKWQIDYTKKLGMYRITRFRDNHWDGDIVFKEVEKENAYCPIYNEKRWIPDIIGYCCKCGYHLNAMEELL